MSWPRFLPFVEAGGYADARWWSPAGWQWRDSHGAMHPRHLSRVRQAAGSSGLFGAWTALAPTRPALQLTRIEAEAWCRWAGRRLPTEAEWECAAIAAHAGESSTGAQVWEWTATAFAPYPGFEPHPYRDYSAPWFDGRPVLRGASLPRPRRSGIRATATSSSPTATTSSPASAAARRLDRAGRATRRSAF